VRRILDDISEQYEAPEKVAAVSVAPASVLDELTRLVEQKWGVETLVLQSLREQLGVKNSYIDPQQLGSDRWAALVAARRETKQPVCVIDCGTAVTVDAMNQQGEFIGGSIFPGLGLLRQSLSVGTAAISAGSGNEEGCQATSTEDGVMSGTRYGLAGAISRIVAEHRSMLGDDMLSILTGGNAESIIPLLDFPVTHMPDLVLFGVKHIAEAQA
jgi:type III pantothenate kinase